MKKVVISPENRPAIAFFEKLNKKKEELRKKIEARISKTAESMTKKQETAK